MATDTVVSGYRPLKSQLERILREGKSRAARAVERELVQTYWQVGDVLHRHLMANQERAGYGEQLMVRLSGDLGIRRQRLYEMLKFRRLFPKVRPAGLLGYSHYTAVLGLGSQEDRDHLLERAELRGWTKRELMAAVTASSRRNADCAEEATSRRGTGEIANSKRLVPKRGELYTYRVAQPDDEDDEALVLDLGFNVEREPEAVPRDTASPGEVVSVSRVRKRSVRYLVEQAGVRRAKLYTYKARVLRVIDGDTLLVKVDLGFRTRIKMRLRLRGIDAPEMKTVEGKRTRDYVKAALSGLPWVVVTTTRPDKYGRYLADVYYSKGEKAHHRGHEEEATKDTEKTRKQGKSPAPEDVAREGQYLNGELLEKGLAKRY